MNRVLFLAALVVFAGCSERGSPESASLSTPTVLPSGAIGLDPDLGPVPNARPTKGPPAEPAAVAGIATLDDLPLTDPALVKRLRRADVIARRLAGEHLTDSRYSIRTIPGRSVNFSLGWNSREAGRRTGLLELSAHSPGQNVNVEGSHTDQALNQSAGEGLVVRASRTPEGAGWGAFVQFWEQAAARPGKGFAILEMHFFHPDHRPAVQPPYSALQLPSARLGLERQFGNFHYQVYVPVYVPALSKQPGVDGWGGGETPKVVALTQKYFASAESFRDTALAELDWFEQAAREGIIGGDSIREYPPEQIVRTDTGRSMVTGGRRAPAEKPTHELTAEQRSGILKEILDQIEQRGALVRTHFKAMHAAAKAAFPLDEYLSDAPDR